MGFGYRFYPSYSHNVVNSVGGKGIDRIVDHGLLIMMKYLRYWLKGGCYFLTAELVECWSLPLTENFQELKTAFRGVK
jgi:hypothetical protein